MMTSTYVWVPGRGCLDQDECHVRKKLASRRACTSGVPSLCGTLCGKPTLSAVQGSGGDLTTTSREKAHPLRVVLRIFGLQVLV